MFLKPGNAVHLSPPTLGGIMNEYSNLVDDGVLSLIDLEGRKLAP